MTGDPEMLKTMTDWFAAQFKLGTPSKVRSPPPSRRVRVLTFPSCFASLLFARSLCSRQNVNTMAAFLTLAYLYEITGERSYLPYLDSWGEWVMNGRSPPSLLFFRRRFAEAIISVGQRSPSKRRGRFRAHNVCVGPPGPAVGRYVDDVSRVAESSLPSCSTGV